MITVIYDHFIAKGGAEKVSLDILKEIPDISLESAYVDKRIFCNESIVNHDCDFQNSLFPSLKLLLFYLLSYKTKPFSDILATGVFSPLIFCFKSCKKKIIYFHTFPTFLTEKHFSLPLHRRIIFRAYCKVHLYLLKLAVAKADHVLCNSKSVQNRFFDILIDTQILYPPVSTSENYNEKSKGYYLVVSRLEKNKQVNIVLDAFTKLSSTQLVVVGDGAMYPQYIEEYSDFSNIHFTGELNSIDIAKYYAECEAIICIPKNEYFGIVPIEAMASGKYIIGVKEGGLLETVSDAKLGFLLSTPVTKESLSNFIVKFECSKIAEKDITFRMQQSQRFAPQFFYSKLQDIIDV